MVQIMEGKENINIVLPQGRCESLSHREIQKTSYCFRLWTEFSIGVLGKNFVIIYTNFQSCFIHTDFYLSKLGNHGYFDFIRFIQMW